MAKLGTAATGNFLSGKRERGGGGGKMQAVNSENNFNWKHESGSTAQNSSAQILTALHFFQKCHLLDRNMSTAWQEKYTVCVPHVNLEQVIKKVQLLEILSKWQNNWNSKI